MNERLYCFACNECLEFGIEGREFDGIWFCNDCIEYAKEIGSPIDKIGEKLKQNDNNM